MLSPHMALRHVNYPALRTTLSMRQMLAALGPLTASRWAAMPLLVMANVRASAGLVPTRQLGRRNLAVLLVLCVLRGVLLPATRFMVDRLALNMSPSEALGLVMAGVTREVASRPFVVHGVTTTPDAIMPPMVARLPFRVLVATTALP